MLILRLIQLLCDNCHAGFQNFLRNQELGSEITPLTTIDIVTEVANILIKMTDKLQNLIFSEVIVSVLLDKI